MKIKLLGKVALGLSICFGGNAIAQTFDGYALYNELNSNTAYLIDENGNIAHTWSCSLTCNYTAQLNDDGNLVRGGVYSGNQLTGAAVSGIVQVLDASGNTVWEFVYSDADHVSHHDICNMPSGNVLLTGREVVSTS